MLRVSFVVLFKRSILSFSIISNRRIDPRIKIVVAVVYGNTRNLGAYKFCVVFWPFFRDNRCLDVFFFFFF